MKRTNHIDDPKNTQHIDLGGGWHFLHNKRLGLVVMICDPSGDKFDFSKNRVMSKEVARRVIRSLVDATPAQKMIYLGFVNGEHLKIKGGAQ